MEATLIQARSQQMQQKEHFLAVQAQRERAEFERVLRYLLYFSVFKATVIYDFVEFQTLKLIWLYCYQNIS